jgi:SAM-dependent methyltransferase
MSMTSIHAANATQADYWNGRGGEVWSDNQDRLDNFLRPISDRLIDLADARPGELVVDVGCGCGATTLKLAERVAPEGEVLGIDVSDTMLRKARERTPDDVPARFVQADATVYRLPPGEIDLVASRFGVMFFADPARSFANLRNGMKPGGRIALACWREARANAWAVVPLRAARNHAPPLPETGPEEPGPFAFADDARIRRILKEAGFADIEVGAEDFELDIAGGRGLDAAVDAATSFGPTGRLLRDQPEDVRRAAAADIRAALAERVVGDRAPLGAAVWMVTARNPD